MTQNRELIHWILKVAVLTLASIVVIVVMTLMAGLFIPSIDNNMIFPIIGPAFNTVIGAFVGLLGGLSLNSKGDFSINRDVDKNESNNTTN